MGKEKAIRILLDLPPADLALLDSIKGHMGLSSRGRVISTLLQAVINIQPPTFELGRSQRLSTKEKEWPADAPLNN